MLRYPIWFYNDFTSRFWNLLLPAYPSIFIQLYLFSLSSWPFLMKFVAFTERTRFILESTEATDIKQGLRPFKVFLICPYCKIRTKDMFSQCIATLIFIFLNIVSLFPNLPTSSGCAAHWSDAILQARQQIERGVWDPFKNVSFVLICPVEPKIQ